VIVGARECWKWSFRETVVSVIVGAWEIRLSQEEDVEGMAELEMKAQPFSQGETQSHT
jgi:ligand-binding SRPBCC domain-containing protein